MTNYQVVFLSDKEEFIFSEHSDEYLQYLFVSTVEHSVSGIFSIDANSMEDAIRFAQDLGCVGIHLYGVRESSKEIFFPFIVVIDGNTVKVEPYISLATKKKRLKTKMNKAFTGVC